MISSMKNGFSADSKLSTLVDDVATVAGYLWEKGWAERNAGNISVRITDLIARDALRVGAQKRYPLPVAYPYLQGQLFLVTGTEKRMRDVAKNPLENLIIIEIEENANHYRVYPLSEKFDSFLPTSELPTHLLLHNAWAQRKTVERVVLHAHVTSLIVLTHFDEIVSASSLNKIILQMHPEMATYLPHGIGFVPFEIPGTTEIATVTLDAFREHEVVVWQKHGAFSIGKNLYDAFDKMDIVAKSASIWLAARQAGVLPKEKKYS